MVTSGVAVCCLLQQNNFYTVSLITVTLSAQSTAIIINDSAYITVKRKRNWCEYVEWQDETEHKSELVIDVVHLGCFYFLFFFC